MLGSKELRREQRKIGNKRIDNERLGNKYRKITNAINENQLEEHQEEKKFKSPLEKNRNKTHQMFQH